MLKYLLLIVFLTGCAAHNSKNIESFYSKSTPQVIKDHVRWAFVLIDENGNISRRIVAELTDITAITCDTAGGKKLKIIHEYPKRSELFQGEPAYQIDGAVLTIDLTANLCDASSVLQGAISDNGVAGRHFEKGLMDFRELGHFYAIPLN